MTCVPFALQVGQVFLSFAMNQASSMHFLQKECPHANILTFFITSKQSGHLVGSSIEALTNKINTIKRFIYSFCLVIINKKKCDAIFIIFCKHVTRCM